MKSSWQHIRFEQDGAIGTLTLSRPPVNALSIALVRELTNAVDRLGADDTLSVVIIRSDQKHFSAGTDLKERKEVPADKVAEMVALFGACVRNIELLPQPTIAAVNGSALGGGAELALACDLRVMAADARIGFTEVALGIIPGAGGTQRLPRLIGASRAKELIFTANPAGADRCLSLGLADRVASTGELQRTAIELARELARNAPLALRAAKAAIIQGLDRPLDDALLAEGKAYGALIHTQDRLEGLKAFLEKRPPSWQGK